MPDFAFTNYPGRVVFDLCPDVWTQILDSVAWRGGHRLVRERLCPDVWTQLPAQRRLAWGVGVLNWPFDCTPRHANGVPMQ
jgi:hypothetical protein